MFIMKMLKFKKNLNIILININKVAVIILIFIIIKLNILRNSYSVIVIKVSLLELYQQLKAVKINAFNEI